MIIGDEHRSDQMRNCSVVVARYGLPNNVNGVIGVIGPTRHAVWAGGVECALSVGPVDRYVGPGLRDTARAPTHDARGLVRSSDVVFEQSKK